MRRLLLALVFLSACSVGTVRSVSSVSPPADMLNPAVTTATIKATICVPGWTATVRPASSYTDALKRRQIASYGYQDLAVAHYEEDHVISLEVGGAPRASSNLFPEPHAVSAPDDSLENALHASVCSGKQTLAQAQAQLYQRKLIHGYRRAASTR